MTLSLAAYGDRIQSTVPNHGAWNGWFQSSIAVLLVMDWNSLGYVFASCLDPCFCVIYGPVVLVTMKSFFSPADCLTLNSVIALAGHSDVPWHRALSPGTTIGLMAMAKRLRCCVSFSFVFFFSNSFFDNRESIFKKCVRTLDVFLLPPCKSVKFYQRSPVKDYPKQRLVCNIAVCGKLNCVQWN